MGQNGGEDSQRKREYLWWRCRRSYTSREKTRSQVSSLARGAVEVGWGIDLKKENYLRSIHLEP